MTRLTRPPRRWPDQRLSLTAAALVTAALVLDLAGALADVERLWQAGYALAWAAVGAALLAAVAWGVGRGVVPAAVGVTAAALLAVATWVRGDIRIPPDPAVLLAEALVAAVLGAAAWLISRAPQGQRQ